MSNFYNHGIFSGHVSHGSFDDSSLAGSSRQAPWGCSETARVNYGPGFTSIVGPFYPERESCYQPSFSSVSCRNVNKNVSREGDNNIGFVGIRICGDGIVAWGDSKSSREDAFGNIWFDEKRGMIQKVFKNEKGGYLFTTFGANTIEVETRNNAIYIEDWLQENVETHETPYQLIEDFANYVRYESCSIKDYHFIIGSKDKCGLYVQGVEVKGESIIFSLKCYRLGASIRNNNVYGPIFDGLICSDDLTCSGFIERQEDWLNDWIKLMDSTCAYNPVGGPIRFETLKFEE